MKINYYNKNQKKEIKRTYRTKKVIKKEEQDRTIKSGLRFIACLFIGVFIGYASDSREMVIINPEVVSSSEVAHSTVIPLRQEQAIPALAEKVNAVMVETKQQENERKIREIAKEFDFKWTDWLVRLAVCESSLNEKISNSKGNTPVGSIDRGIFQINNYWHSEVSDECAYNLRCSTIWTMQRVNTGYQSEWVCNNKI